MMSSSMTSEDANGGSDRFFSHLDERSDGGLLPKIKEKPPEDGGADASAPGVSVDMEDDDGTFSWKKLPPSSVPVS